MNDFRVIVFALGFWLVVLSPAIINIEIASWVFFTGLSIAVLAVIHLFTDFKGIFECRQSLTIKAKEKSSPQILRASGIRKGLLHWCIAGIRREIEKLSVALSDAYNEARS